MSAAADPPAPPSADGSRDYGHAGYARYAWSYLTIAVLFLALVAYQIYQSKREARNAAIAEAKNLALVLESRLNADLGNAVRTVSAMAAEIDPEAMRPQLAGRFRAQMSRQLKSRALNVAAATALRYFDADGERLYTNLDEEFAVNIGDRPFFRKMKADAADAVVFSEVVVGRYSGRASMNVAKPVRDRNGAFLGIAVAPIDLSALYLHFRSIELGAEGVVTLRRLDNGALVVRFPGPIEVDNQPEPDMPMRVELINNVAGGSIELNSPVDGLWRVYGYRAIGAFPFYVAVGIANDSFLAKWRKSAVALLAVSLLFLGVLAAIFFRLALAEARQSRGEWKLRESEQRFRSLIEHNNAVMLQIDPESGRILDANAAALRFYGWSLDAMRAMRLQDIDQPDSDKAEAEREAARKERRACAVFSHRRAGGDTRIVEMHSTPVAMGRHGVLVAIVLDITERVRNEDRVVALLREQKAILDSRIAGIVKLKDRRFVWVNDAFAHMLGYTKEEIIGQPTRLGYASDAAYEAFARAAYQTLLKGDIYRTEAQCLRKDGSLGWYRIGGSMLFPGSDESIWVFAEIDGPSNGPGAPAQRGRP
jgi:PAS domain S-box-containing protein